MTSAAVAISIFEGVSVNTKRIMIAGIVVFLVFEILSNIIRILVLDGVQELNVMYGDIVWAFLFIIIFVKGYEGRGLAEGLRFGLLMGIFISSLMVFGSNVNCVSCNLPFTKSALWFVSVVLQVAVCGILAAVLYKPKN